MSRSDWGGTGENLLQIRHVALCGGGGAKGGGHCPGLDMKIKINRGYIFLVLRLFGYICTWVNNLQKKRERGGGGVVLGVSKDEWNYKYHDR